MNLTNSNLSSSYFTSSSSITTCLNYLFFINSFGLFDFLSNDSDLSWLIFLSFPFAFSSITRQNPNIHLHVQRNTFSWTSVCTTVKLISSSTYVGKIFITGEFIYFYSSSWQNYAFDFFPTLLTWAGCHNDAFSLFLE